MKGRSQRASRRERSVSFHPRRRGTLVGNRHEHSEQFDHTKCNFSFSVCMYVCMRVYYVYIFYKIYTYKIYLYLFFHTLILLKCNTYSITLLSSH